MALTANVESERFVDLDIREYDVEAASHVFKGALVGKSASGHAQPLVAGNVFLGVAYEESDNSAGVDGDTKVRVYSFGDFLMTLAVAALTNIGAPVYASADDTLTFTATANSRVGWCVDMPEAGKIILRIEPFQT